MAEDNTYRFTDAELAAVIRAGQSEYGQLVRFEDRYPSPQLVVAAPIPVPRPPPTFSIAELEAMIAPEHEAPPPVGAVEPVVPLEPPLSEAFDQLPPMLSVTTPCESLSDEFAPLPPMLRPSHPTPSLPHSMRDEIRDLCRCGYTVEELKNLAPVFGVEPSAIEAEARRWERCEVVDAERRTS